MISLKCSFRLWRCNTYLRFHIFNKLPGEAGGTGLPATLRVARAHGGGLMAGVSVVASEKLQDLESEALHSNPGSSTFQGKSENLSRASASSAGTQGYYT